MRINLRVKLVLIIIAIIIFANITLGVVAFRHSNEAMTKSINQSLTILSEKVSTSIEEMNEQEFLMLRSLSHMPFLQDGTMDLQEINNYLQNLITIDEYKYENIAFYDANGDSYTTDGRKINFKGRSYFEKAMAGGEFVSVPMYSPVIDDTLQFYSVPVFNDIGRVIGCVSSVIKGDRLTEFCQLIDIGAGFCPAIVDRESGKNIVNVNAGTNDDNGAAEDLDPESELGKVIGELMSGEVDTFVFTDPTLNVKMTGSFRPITNTTWSVFCVAPYDYFYAGLKSIQIAIGIGLLASILAATIIGYIVIRILIKPLFTIKNAIMDIASGNADLTQRLPNTSDDEIGDVVKGFNNFTEKLQSIVKDINLSNNELEEAGSQLNNSSQETIGSIEGIISSIASMNTQIGNQGSSVAETAGAVNQIASNIESLEKMVENQVNGVKAASETVEEMISNIASVNASMDQMSESFIRLTESAQSGSSLQANATDRIERIRTQSETLQEANFAISAIAEQTNLLAMNAAIEAAHAGDAGKGFSVVADEIRKLSETSGEQSRTIGEQLNNIRGQIEEMVNASKQSSDAFQDVTVRIKETDELVKQVKLRMEEQTEGSQKITQALQEMNDSSLEVRTASKEMAEGNKAILEEVKNLQDATSVMNSSMEEMASSARKINETGSELNNISATMMEKIDDIGMQINQFKV